MELPLRSERRKPLEKILTNPAKSIKELTERTLSLYWASRTGNHKLVVNLLQQGADPHVCHPDSGEGALHTAAFHGHCKVVEVLLANGASPNCRTGFPSEETPLHVILRHWQPGRPQWTKVREERCFQQLLAARGVDVDTTDGTGVTPVHLAARLGLWNFVEILLQQHRPNLDAEADDGSTARQLIEAAGKSGCWPLPERRRESQLVGALHLALGSLREGRHDDFVSLLESRALCQAELQNCLKSACSLGREQAVRVLVKHGADPNDFVCEPPVVVAAKHGHPKVLTALLENQTVSFNRCDHPLWQRSPLHLAVISATSSAGTEGHVECVRLLLDRRPGGLELDALDFRGNTALHYAAKASRRDLVRLLLGAGCSLFVCNQQGEPGFLNVDIEDVRTHLDGFISLRGFTERNHSLELDYQFLKQTEPGMLEMCPLLLLSRSSAHRALLKHPLIVSFLHLKWQRLKGFFYLKFFIYLLFALSLSLHVYVAQLRSIDGDYSQHPFTAWICAPFLGLFVLVEVLEVAAVSPKRYLNSWENCLKLSLVVLAVVLLTVELGRSAGAVVSTAAVLCAYTEMALLIGTHPRFATYISMFLRVARNFIGFFGLFSCLIFAFAFSFFVLFHECPDQEDSCRFYSTLGGSVFKTVVMLTGELEAEGLRTDPFGYALFLLFVVCVPICLLNLMTGLAVSDIAAIRDEAEVQLLAAKAQLYAGIESALLGGWRRQCLERRFCLLPHALPDCRLTWFLDLDNKMEPEVGGWFSEFVPGSLLRLRRLEWLAIVKQAQQIAATRDQLSSEQILEAKIDELKVQVLELKQILAEMRIENCSLRNTSSNKL